MSTPLEEHLPQRFEIPADAPAGPVDPYQVRMARAQRGYQAEQDSAWGSDAVRAEGKDAQDDPWQAPAVETESRKPFRWLRRRRESVEPEPVATTVATQLPGDIEDASADLVEPAEPARRGVVEEDQQID